MKYNTTIEQQDAYVNDLREMWHKIQRIHGLYSVQEEALFKILHAEDERLKQMKEGQNEQR